MKTRCLVCVEGAVLLTERLRTHTLGKITDAAAAALLLGLIYPRAALPPGVFEASADRLRDAHPRFAWAAAEIAAEIAAAPNVVVCTTTGLGVCWSEIYSPRINNPSMAQHRGRLVARTGASFARELLDRMTVDASDTCRAALATGYEDELREMKKAGTPIPRKRRAQPSDLDSVVTRAKRMERELRAEFDGVEDMGGEPSAAERRDIVRILSLGVTAPQICQALQGRAVQCHRSRMWDGIDTAEEFLRLRWICSSLKRFEDALAAAPIERPKSAVVKTEHGTFVGGRQLIEPFIDPDPAPGDPRLLDEWLASRQGE